MSMRTGQLASAILALVPASVWAQAGSPPTAPAAGPPATGGGNAALTAVVLLVVVVIAIGALVKLLDLRRRRESEAVQLQAQVSDALLRDPQLFGLPITPTAHVGWRGSPATLEISGQVPTDEAREAVLRMAREEARRIRPDVTIEDRLVVVPTMAHAA